MSENWRRKTYYKPRVLISTEHVLTPTFDDTLICLTGSELEMLRNLTQYLHRRSTFVSEYEPDHYLAPSTAEWDTLQAIVADLEEKLMGCPEITALLEDILAAAQCVCNQTTTLAQYGPSVTPVIGGYLDDGTFVVGDEEGGSYTIDAERCALSQLTYGQAYEMLTEIIQPTQEVLMDILLPVAVALFVSAVGTPVLGIPAGLLVGVLNALGKVATEGNLSSVTNAYLAAKEELVCALYRGLATSYREAETQAVQVIEGIAGLSPIDKILLHSMIAPWAISLAKTAYDNATDWAINNVTPGYCAVCTWPFAVYWRFPPCPGDFTGGFPCTPADSPGLNQAEFAYSPSFEIPSIGQNVDIQIICRYTSKFGPGWTVGYAQVEYQDAGLTWHLIGQNQVTTSEPVGEVNESITNTLDVTVPRNVLRFNMHGQPGQADSNPWPFQPVFILASITPHV